MSIVDDQELRNMREIVIDEMIDLMTFAEVIYTRDDVEECKNILEEHLYALAGAQNPSAAKDCVRDTVLRLNEINSKTGGDLIDSGKRDKICDYFSKSGAMLGYNKEYEDVTEKWREW
jgi:hypothetical protein